MGESLSNCRNFLVVLTLLLSACGGGGDSDAGGIDAGDGDVGGIDAGGGMQDQPDPVTNSVNQGNTPTIVNKDFTGSLFIDDDGGYIDLASGNFYSLAPDDADHLISPSKDGVEYVETIDDFEDLSGALSGSNDAIIIRDMQTGFTVDSFEIRESLIGPAKLSPDRQFVAAVWRNEAANEDFDEDRLTLFSRDGNVISRSLQQNIYRFDWLPDGRLIFASLDDRSLYLSDNPNSTDATLLRAFSVADGYPGWVRVSPDGTRIVFELISEFSDPFSRWRHGTVWTMNIDGSNLTQLATDGRDKPLLNTPVWSPDNEWVLTLQGSKSGIAFVPDPIQTNLETVSVTGVAGAIFAVRADGENQLVPENTESVKPIFRLTSSNTKNFLRTSYDSSLMWLPALPQAEEQAGNLPDNTLLHRGLSGSIYFGNSAAAGIEASNIDTFDLSSSLINTLFSVTEDDTDYVRDLLYLSEDEQWVSHYFDDTFNPALRIYNAAGELQISLPLEASNDIEIIPTSRVQFSPVNTDLVLFSYKYLQDGWQNKAMVLNWRTGTIVKAFLDGQYLASEWTRDGHVLLTARDSGNIYQSINDSGVYSEPVWLFDLSDPVKDIALNPQGDRLAIEMLGSIWTINMDGTGLKRVTARGRHFYAGPEWSPDSRFIMLKTIDSDDDNNDLGDLWIVAADAEDVVIHYPSNTKNAIPLVDSSNNPFDIFGTYSWR